jgi:hypothetical protein
LTSPRIKIAQPLRRIGPAAAIRQVSLGARVAALPSAMERGNTERAKLYATPRWRRERRAFLKAHPVCVTTGCGQRSQVVDHRDGHQAEGWLARFWNQTRWDALCLSCHGVKSRAELTAWRQAGEAPSRVLLR